MAKIMQSHERYSRTKQGFTLMELLVAMGVGGITVLIMQGLMASIFQSAESLQIDAEIQEIAAGVLSRVHCEKTFAANGIDGRTGAGPAANLQIQLRDKSDRSVLSSHSLGGVFAPYKQIDSNWFADATWTGRSIALKLARKAKNNMTWGTDPYTGRDLSFSAGKQLIYADPPTGVPLCAISNTSTVLALGITPTISVVGPLTDGLNDHSSANDFLTGPIYLNKGCHYYCATKGYTSGVGLGVGDSYPVYDGSGNITGTVPYLPGQGPVTCRCFI